jgi:alpha-galactosidase
MAAGPLPGEMDGMHRWVAAKFEGTTTLPEVKTGIEVLANHGPVQPNARGDAPMHLGDRAYDRGLYCHAPSRLVVHLPSAGRSFEALAGVDTNDQTSGGRGSVVFAVRVGEDEAWRSEVMREGMPGVPVAVPLNGAREFTLEVGDAGDGIACDQADWLEARVTLADGGEVWLGDLPIYGRSKAPYDTELPFSFTYGERPSAELLPSWRVERNARELSDPRHGTRTEHTLVYTDPSTRLQVRCVGIEYHDFPTVEWTLHFRNGGTQDTPILSDICAIDTRFERTTGSEFTLHSVRGDDCTDRSYEPFAEALGPGAEYAIANTSGRPTQNAFPYFNLAWPGEGVICVLSWAGQWSARFACDEAANVRIVGGQELTHFTLHPGEEVRGPLVVLQFYQGEWLRAQNVWRRWMLAHNLPMPGGKPLPTLRSLCTGNYYPGLMTVAEQEKVFLQRHLDEGVNFDLWWQDAGWYPCDGVGWPKVGTWEPDPVRFPHGLREISDLMHASGKRTMVWFEPERVHPGTWIAQEHPEWVHGGQDGGLLRLDDPACRQWLTDHIDRLLTEQGIDFYRQDFNIDPLPYWRANDAPDRQGITEIRHIEGYFAYWDELRRRHPEMLIDSCASGGRRNDLETLRRAVPLLRSDWYWSPEGQQCLTYGLSLWFPYQGTGVVYDRDVYWWRSSMVAELSFGPDARGLDHVDFARLRRMVDEHRLISPCFLGDFHPLTAYTHAADQWMAWQFDRPDLGTGVVQAFRRPESIYESARLRLQGLDAQAAYEVRDLDADTVAQLSGRELTERGLLVTLTERPGSAVVTYERA